MALLQRQLYLVLNSCGLQHIFQCQPGLDIDKLGFIGVEIIM